MSAHTCHDAMKHFMELCPAFAPVAMPAKSATFGGFLRRIFSSCRVRKAAVTSTCLRRVSSTEGVQPCADPELPKDGATSSSGVLGGRPKNVW